MATRLYKHGETVRLIDSFWTPSQRNTLWVVDWSSHSMSQDWGSANVPVHRKADVNCLIYAPRELIAPATVLDLLADV